MYKKTISVCAVIILIILCLTGTGISGGLRTTFVEMKVENLQIGKTYHISKIKKFPLVLWNTSDILLNVKIDILIPKKSDLKKGYLPIPQTNWIKVVPDYLDIAPGKTNSALVSIIIPDNKKYLGKSYQVYIWSHTVNKDIPINIGLKSRILLKIADRVKKKKKIKQIKIKKSTKR